MKGDLEYRKLLEKCGYTMGITNLDILTEDEIREKMHRVKRAIMEIEERMRQQYNNYKGVELNNTMRKMLFEQMDVAELYSQPRAIRMAENMGLRAGWSLDLTTCDDQGRPWDSNDVNMSSNCRTKSYQR